MAWHAVDSSVIQRCNKIISETDTGHVIDFVARLLDVKQIHMQTNYTNVWNIWINESLKIMNVQKIISIRIIRMCWRATRRIRRMCECTFIHTDAFYLGCERMYHVRCVFVCFFIRMHLTDESNECINTSLFMRMHRTDESCKYECIIVSLIWMHCTFDHKKCNYLVCECVMLDWLILWCMYVWCMCGHTSALQHNYMKYLYVWCMTHVCMMRAVRCMMIHLHTNA